MNGSRTIHVLKRDSSRERFCPRKLAGAMYRAMHGRSLGRYRDARDLALAVGIYLRRAGRCRVSSAAVLEMTLKILRRVRMDSVAAAMEEHQVARRRRRRSLWIGANGQRRDVWEKRRLVQLGIRRLALRRATARLLAGAIEADLLDTGVAVVDRAELLERLETRAAEYGLLTPTPVP